MSEHTVVCSWLGTDEFLSCARGARAEMRGTRAAAWIGRVSRRSWRSAELERRRMERECAEKARVVEPGAMLDANAAVWMPDHIDDAEQVQRASVEAARKLERSSAA